MQYRCSELGLDDTHLRCSLFSSLVQPVLSYGCEVWCLERSSLFLRMNTVHNYFMKRTLHVRKSVPEGVALCELGRMPLQVHWQKMVLKYVSRLSKLPSDRLVKKAFTHASSVNTLWWQKLSLWLSQHGFEGVLAEGTFSLANAEQHSGTNVTTAFANLQLQRSVFSWTTCFLTPMSWPLSFVT